MGDAAVSVDEDEQIDKESDDENMVGREPVWEAPRGHNKTVPISSQDHSDSSDSSYHHNSPDSDSTLPPDNGSIPVPPGQDQLRQCPRYIDLFGGRAGAPINNSVPLQSGYSIYASSIEGDKQNPYAPFQSSVDLEIAKWAKLRASGSTAFSDLIAIDGVRFFVFMYFLFALSNYYTGC